MHYKFSKDISGKRFGRLVAIERDPEVRDKHRRAVWRCRCDCGKTVYATYSALSEGHVQSCGCLAHDKRLTIKARAGERYGSLIALRPMNKMGLAKERYVIFWLCRCDCGREIVVSDKALQNGSIRSCGCIEGSVSLNVLVGNPKDSCWKEFPQDFIVGPVYGRKTSRISFADAVGIQRRGRKYIATLELDGANVELGAYTTVDDAVEARRNAQEMYVRHVLSNWIKLQPRGKEAIEFAENIRENVRAWLQEE